MGETGAVMTALEPRGVVRVRGESWSAESDSGEPIQQGEEVIVSDVEGLTLKVFKADQ